MQKHKINGALDQNTNSNHNFKTNQIRTKKRRRRAKLTHLSLGGKDMPWWEEKKGTHLTHLCVRERERKRESFLNALEQTKCQRKKEKGKVKRRNARKEKKKRKRSEDRAPAEERKKSKVKIETRERCGGEKKEKKGKRKETRG